MKRITEQILIILLCVSLYNCGNGEYEIYLSPNGNDNAIGSLSDPIKSLHRAVELTKELGGKVPVTIYLSNGTYHLTEPIELTLGDSGNEVNPIKWKALPGEKPIVSGGISLANWTKEDNGSWSVSLPKDYTGKFRSFYVNDNRAIRARFPNSDYLRIDKAGQDNRTNFFFKENDFPKVINDNNLELVFLHDWSITRINIKSINWKTNHLITVDSIGARLPFFKITNWEKEPRYYLENALEYCDSPGEWYCDYNKRKIYYFPRPEDKIDNTEGVIPVATKLVTIKGSENKRAGFIKFEGITFAHTEWNLPASGYCGIQACMFTNRSNKIPGWDKVPAAIELDLVQNIEFNNCTIKHIGGSGIWIRENSSECEISNSHIYDIAGNGINIGEGSDRLVNGIPWWKSVREEVSNNNRVSNSLIEDCGKQFFGAVGIWGGLVSNTLVEHNEVRNLPYTGVSIGWMWDTTATPCKENIISSNHIHYIMNILSDGGGIYSLGQQPGSRIVDNIIHDVTVNIGRAESNGMFLDEGTKDLVVENNIVYNIAKSPLRFHKAFGNLVKNNVFAIEENIPPIQYNRTIDENIRKVNNTLLKLSSDQDMEKLQLLVQKRIKEIDIKRNFN